MSQDEQGEFHPLYTQRESWALLFFPGLDDVQDGPEKCQDVALGVQSFITDPYFDTFTQ